MIHPRVDAAAYTLATLVKPLNTAPVALQKTVLAAPHTTVLVTFLYGGCSMRASALVKILNKTPTVWNNDSG